MNVGQDASPFNLPNQANEPVELADFAGRWVVLYWYPKADTPGCAAQAQGLRDQQEGFDELSCTVLGASFDTVEDNASFHAKYGLTFDLLSDPQRSVGRAFGVVGDGSYANRTAFLIDPNGRVERVYEVDAPEFFADRVLDDLEELQDE